MGSMTIRSTPCATSQHTCGKVITRGPSLGHQDYWRIEAHLRPMFRSSHAQAAQNQELLRNGAETHNKG